MNHKPMCKINMTCLVIHPDGICPGPYGKCDCGAEAMTENKEKKCCPKCRYPFAEQQGVDESSAACTVCPCHSQPAGAEGWREALRSCWTNNDGLWNRNAYYEEVCAIVATEIAAAEKTAFESGKQAMREELREKLQVYSVIAPGKSRAATFTPEQFLSLFLDNQ